MEDREEDNVEETLVGHSNGDEDGGEDWVIQPLLPGMLPKTKYFLAFILCLCCMSVVRCYAKPFQDGARACANCMAL